jgi:hypothetical protein
MIGIIKMGRFFYYNGTYREKLFIVDGETGKVVAEFPLDGICDYRNWELCTMLLNKYWR